MQNETPSQTFFFYQSGFLANMKSSQALNEEQNLVFFFGSIGYRNEYLKYVVERRRPFEAT